MSLFFGGAPNHLSLCLVFNCEDCHWGRYRSARGQPKARVLKGLQAPRTARSNRTELPNILETSNLLYNSHHLLRLPIFFVFRFVCPFFFIVVVGCLLYLNEFRIKAGIFFFKFSGSIFISDSVRKNIWLRGTVGSCRAESPKIIYHISLFWGTQSNLKYPTKRKTKFQSSSHMGY